jgi:hypothetical protein
MERSVNTTLAGAAWAGGHTAVRDAVDLAADGLPGPPGLVLVFPDAEIDGTEALVQAEAAAPTARVAGMSSDGLITDAGVRYGGCSALAFADELRVGVGLARGAREDPAGAGRLAAEAATAGLELREGHGVVLLFLDPTSEDESRIIDGAYEIVGGRIPLAGGGANGSRPIVIGDGAAASNGVVAVAIASPAPISVGISHGCLARPASALVTRADGRAIRELDGRAAETVYLEGIDARERELDDGAFESLAVRHPLAQPELRGEVRLRHVLGRAAGGGLRCTTRIPPNAAVWFTEQTEQSIVASAAEAVEQAIAQLPGPARAALAFDCAARKRALGYHLMEEAAALVRAFGSPPPLAGLYTRGEVGRRRGAKGDLNHAAVVVGFG